MADLGGDLLATGCRENRLRVWDAQKGKQLLTRKAHPVLGTSTSPSGGEYTVVHGHLVFLPPPLAGILSIKALWASQVATGHATGEVVVWKLGAGDDEAPHVLRGHVGAVWALAPVIADGAAPRLASGGLDGCIRLWDVGAGTCARVIAPPRQRGYRDAVGLFGLAALPGALLAASYGDGTLRLWDATTGDCDFEHDDAHGVGIKARRLRCRRTRSCHALDRTCIPLRAQVNCLAVLADGRLVSGGDDKRVRVWRVNGRALEPDGEAMCGKGEVESVAAAGAAGEAGGAWVLTGGCERRVRLWSVKERVDEAKLHGHREAVNSVTVVRRTITAAQASRACAARADLRFARACSWGRACCRPSGGARWRRASRRRRR